MYRDDDADPPVLVCQVGSTTLKYHASAIDCLHAWLREQGDWVPLGAADESKTAADGTVEAWGRAPDNPVGGWYGLPRPLRHVPAAAAGSARPGRAHPRRPEQPGAGDLAAADREHEAACLDVAAVDHNCGWVDQQTEDG